MGLKEEVAVVAEASQHLIRTLEEMLGKLLPKKTRKKSNECKGFTHGL